MVLTKVLWRPQGSVCFVVLAVSCSIVLTILSACSIIQYVGPCFDSSILMMVGFKGDSCLYAIAFKNSLTIFLYILQFSMVIISNRSQHAGGNG